jgi:hypothetical protein
MNENELKVYILGFLASKGFKLRPEDKPAMKSIFKGTPDWMIDFLVLKEGEK